MKMRRILCSLAAALALTLGAQIVERPVLSSYTVEAGSAHLVETYLSPLKYSGWGTALGYERMQAMRFDPDRWTMQLRGRLGLQGTRNLARNATMWDVDLELAWGMMRRFRLPEGFTIMAGGSTGVDAGVFYNARNSNNPAAAKAAWTVRALGAAVWNGRVGRLPLCLRYQAELPLAGMFFSPEYGELYYEIYLGNHKGLLRGAWPGNYFRLNNLLTCDLRLGRTNLRVGYRFDVLSTKASRIVTRRIGHYFVFGIANEWISLGARNTLSEKTRIINALY